LSPKIEEPFRSLEREGFSVFSRRASRRVIFAGGAVAVIPVREEEEA
jgi:hypothetical protein